jgi:hypothetical protein
LQIQIGRRAISVASYESSGIISEANGRRYKYLRTRKNGNEELYDISDDTELRDLASEPDFQVLKKQLSDAHEALVSQIGGASQ